MPKILLTLSILLDNRLSRYKCFIFLYVPFLFDRLLSTILLYFLPHIIYRVTRLSTSLSLHTSICKIAHFMQERTGFCILGLSCLARVSISIYHIKTVTSISKHSSIAQRIQLQIMMARYTDIDVDIDHSVYPIVECLRKCSVIEP